MVKRISLLGLGSMFVKHRPLFDLKMSNYELIFGIAEMGTFKK
jgi:hypothetical protein